jgi:hypothetical protein
VCKAIGLKLVFAPSVVQQDRNVHNYMADFQSELPLYLRAERLVQQLEEFNFTDRDGDYPAAVQSLPGMIEHLWVHLYERGYIEVGDVHLVQAWLVSLKNVGYMFPSPPK